MLSRTLVLCCNLHTLPLPCHIYTSSLEETQIHLFQLLYRNCKCTVWYRYRHLQWYIAPLTRHGSRQIALIYILHRNPIDHIPSTARQAYSAFYTYMYVSMVLFIILLKLTQKLQIVFRHYITFVIIIGNEYIYKEHIHQ